MIGQFSKYRDAVFSGIQAAVTSSSHHPREAALARMFGAGTPTHSGQRVDHDSAIAIPAIYRGVNIISNAVANVPYYVFQNDDLQRKVFAKGHTSWRAIAVKPHPEIKTFDFVKAMTAWALQWGNAVAHIYRPKWPHGPVAMTPLLPDRTRPFRLTEKMVKDYGIEDNVGDLYYETEIGGKTYAYPASDCIHIRGLGGNPYWGYDVVETLVEALGGAQAKIEFGNRFYGQGANPAGFFEMDGSLSEEAEQRLRKSLQRGMEGMSKAHRVMLLEEGAKFHQWTIDPAKAQFIEGLQFDYRVLANVLGVKVHKLIDGANSAYNSLEMAEHEHMKDDILPWVNQWKGEYQTKLLTERQQNEMSHCVDADDEKLEGFVPYEQRVNGTVHASNNNLITRDEGRSRLNWGPSTDGLGNRHTMPMNIEFTQDKAQLAAAEIAHPQPRNRPEDDVVPTDDNAPEDDTHEDDDSATVAVIDAGETDNESAEANAAQTSETGPIDPTIAAGFAELRTAWLDKIQTRIGKQAVKLVQKDTGDFIAWVDRLSSENAPACVQGDVDEFYAAVKTTFAEMINTPTGDNFDLAAAVADEVGQWTASPNEETEQ